MKSALLISIFGLFCLTAIGQIPSIGLVGRWTFDGNSSDVSGNGNNGSVYGASLTDDRCSNPNSAYYFDGDDYIECTPNSMAVSDAISISIWFLTTTSGLDALVSKYSWSSDVGYVAQFDATRVPEIRGRDGNGVFSESDTDGISRSDQTWHHFVGIVNGSEWTTWIDTILIGSYDNGHSNVAIGSCFLPLTFGRLSEYSTTSWRYYTGVLDDITIYNRAINESEIIQLFNDDCLPLSTTTIDLNPFKVTVFPNPTSGKISIIIPDILLDVNNVSMENILGEEVIIDKKMLCDNHEIDISHLSKGTYFLHISSESKTSINRIILN